MKFELPPLPYAKEALEPHMGRETLEFHYEKHHRGYLDKLQQLIEGKPEAALPLEDLIRKSDGAVFNNAAQVWNHTFFWNCMQPAGGGKPGGEIGQRLADAFGSFDKFRDTFVEAGAGRFGSGYAWLVLEKDSIRCISTPNAESPLAQGSVPLLTCDVWEHAYYLDHRNRRVDYLKVFLQHLVNWDFVEEALRKASRPK